MLRSGSFLLAGFLLLGGALHVAAQEPVPAELAPKLNPELLRAVDDNKLFPDFRGKAPDEIEPREKQEYDAYCEALLTAAITPEKAFAHSARENERASYGHLFNDPSAYRGQVVTIRGKLKRLREWQPPRPVFKSGVEKFYEGWIYADTPGSNPVCVMVAELPPGIKTGEWIDHRVTFHGYFFKKYVYFTAKDRRVTLLCVGRTLVPEAQPARTGSAGMPTGFLTAVVGFIAGVLFLVLLLHWWLNRGDRKFRARMAQLQTGQPWEGPAGGEDAPPPQERTIHPNGN
jgi:hypothetical protein